MPTYADVRMAPPTSWDEFEKIVCSAAKNRWKNPDFTRHGRQGQQQDGVDVYGKDETGRLVGLQCKNTMAGVAPKAVGEEVANVGYGRLAASFLAPWSGASGVAKHLTMP